MRTQVGIVGAGPAGLLLAHLLGLQGIESVVIEIRSRAHIEQRVRAGVLEQGTVDLLRATGLGDRMDREGLVHQGIELRFGGVRRRIPFDELVPGRAITVYGQQEIVKNLIAARLAAGGAIEFEVCDVTISGPSQDHLRTISGLPDAPTITYTKGGKRHELDCDFVAGCDGYHGVSRPAIPRDALAVYERRLARGARRRGPLHRRADLLRPRARVRLAPRPHPADQPLLPAGQARRGPVRAASRP